MDMLGLAAAWGTAGSWFRSANEGAHYFAGDSGGNRIHVYALVREESAGVLDVINASGFDFNGGEACTGQLGGVFSIFEGTGYAADPEFEIAADFNGDVAAHNDVRDGEAAARL